MPQEYHNSSEEPPTRHVQERHSVQRYDKMGEVSEESTPANTWGLIEWNGEVRSVYQDTELMRMFVNPILTTKPHGVTRFADFGGANGKVLREVFTMTREAQLQELYEEQLATGLSEEGARKVADDRFSREGILPIGLTIDAELKVKDGKTTRAWNEFREANPDDTSRVFASATDYMQEVPNIAPDSLDIALSRYSLQYVSAENHTVFLKRQADLVKPGGQVLAQWPGAADERSEVMLNTFWSNFAHITQGVDPAEFLTRQHYPTLEQVQKAVEDAGLTITSLESVPNLKIFMYEEALSNGTRFTPLSESQKADLRELYVHLHNEFPDLVHFDEETDNYWTSMTLGMLVAEKPTE